MNTGAGKPWDIVHPSPGNLKGNTWQLNRGKKCKGSWQLIPQLPRVSCLVLICNFNKSIILEFVFSFEELVFLYLLSLFKVDNARGSSGWKAPSKLFYAMYSHLLMLAWDIWALWTYYKASGKASMYKDGEL